MSNKLPKGKHRILVTGVAGLLGSHLYEALEREGHDVWGVDSLISGDVRNVPNKKKTIEADTSDFIHMKEILEMIKPDTVYHLACTPYEGLSVVAPQIITKNTFDNTMGILSASVQRGVKRFVYASSMSRYGDQKTPFTEDMAPKPEDPYAVAKVASEMVVKQMSETYGIEYVIAVPHNIIGTRQAYWDPYRNVVSIMINRCLQGKAPIIYGDGTQTRCFSYIDDVLYSLVRMIDCPSGETYNIGPDDVDGEVLTINQLADIVMEVTGFEGKPIHMPSRPREVKHAFTSSAKIRKEFNYETKTSVKEAITEMTRDIQRLGTREFDYDFILPEIINEKTPRTWTERLL